jgi:hypothetical protein
MAARIISNCKTTLRSAGARVCWNHQAINISPRWGEEPTTTSVAFKLESTRLSRCGGKAAKVHNS